MKAVILSVVFSALLSCHVSAAESITGNSLYQLCHDKDTDGLCAMWVTGFLNGVVAAKDKRLPAACPPPKVTGGQARLVIEKFMSDHPDLLHMSAHGVADAALAGAFPCKASN